MASALIALLCYLGALHYTLVLGNDRRMVFLHARLSGFLCD